mgnify:CR=1 FL=1
MAIRAKVLGPFTTRYDKRNPAAGPEYKEDYTGTDNGNDIDEVVCVGDNVFATKRAANPFGF